MMLMSGSAIKRLGVIAAVAGLVVATQVAGSPAQAGKNWGPSQQVSSKFGRATTISDNGSVAAWIRTNQTTGQGPVRTGYYRSPKKGWTSSAEVVGTVGSSDIQMSSDGFYLLADVPGTGLVMSERLNKNTWSSAQPVVSGQYVRIGKMSADSNTVAYGQFSDPSVTPPAPGVLNVITRVMDGPWSAPVALGSLNSTAYRASGYEYVAMSRDGNTIAWVDDAWALRAVTQQPDGTWSAPVLIKQFPDISALDSLLLSADGTRLVYTQSWDVDGIFTATRSGNVWSPLSSITADAVNEVALSPNGIVVAYSADDDQQMIVKSWNGGQWGRAKVLGSIKSWGTDIALSNKTVAWTYGVDKTLRSSIYANGKWNSPVKLAGTGLNPVLTPNGRTVLWSTLSSKKIYSKMR